MTAIHPVNDIDNNDIDWQREWSDETFGPGNRLEGVLKHIEKEVQEVRESGGRDVSEWADIIILAIDGATRSGFTGQAVIAAYHRKMEENEAREWPDWRECSTDEPIEHIRHEVEPLPALDPADVIQQYLDSGRCSGQEGRARAIAAAMPDEYPAGYAEFLAGGAVAAPEEMPGE